jgi:isoleucyl-tRNA synthetase
MSLYPQPGNLNFYSVSEEILQWWKKEKVFEASVSSREGAEPFTFFEGPPSANGTPGIHHVMARTIKDIFCRYQTLKGRQVKRKGGWDTHGLPIELQVEKELGITKEDIGKTISVEDYNKKCREAVMKFTGQWNELTEMMGYWVDLDDPYITYKNDYIETLWFLLKRLYDKGLLYKGYTIQPFSPAAGTGLSSHELNQPGTYKEVKDTSIVAQFKVIRNSASEALFAGTSSEVFILAWTTTPWTLPSNSALTVGKNIDYLLIETFNPYTHFPVAVVCAKDRVSAYFQEAGKDADFAAWKAGDKIIPWKVLGSWKGAALEGIQYEQLLPYVKPEGKAFEVITGDFVTTEDGTGVVHTAPTFGADDFRVAQQHGIAAILVKGEDGKPAPLVNRQGRFVAEVVDFAHEPVKEQYLSEEEKAEATQKQGRDKYLSVDERIGIKLKTENRAFQVQKFEHPYPHCWRTDKPVLYYPMDSWFIRTTAVKDKLVALNKQINWKPESTGSGRFGNWLENLVDWNLSRSRYWGTPLPIWRNDSGEEICIGSMEQLRTEIEKALDSGKLDEDQINHNQAFLNGIASGDFDLHRPFVDHLWLVSASGKVLTRESDLIDVWFDSGAMPYAQWHYPFENQQTFKDNFPADFISEGVDQTRGWFFTLHALATMLSEDEDFGGKSSPAFLNVVSTGLVLDKDGEKMSKRKGNVINPFEALRQYGPDPVRWYMISNSNPWDNLKFNLEGVTEVRNKFFGTLANTYGFFALYANIDGFRAEAQAPLPLAKRSETDRWVLSKLNSLIKEVDACYAEYEPTRAARAIQDFVSDQLSNWYVRLGRKRFWRGEMNENKLAAYQTLHECLDTIARLMSPVAPFFAEWLYQSLSGKTDFSAGDSVHLCRFPDWKEEFNNPELESAMDLAQRTCSLVHSLRKNHRLKVRQPLGRMLMPVPSPAFRKSMEQVEELILSEVNIRKLEYIENTAGLVEKSAKPNFRKLGKSLGPKLKAFGDAVAALSQEQILEYETKGSLSISVDGSPYQLEAEDLEIRSENIPGWVVANDQEITVALDLALNEDLLMEGIARDVVNRVQNQRKDLGFEVLDRIELCFNPGNFELAKKALLEHREYICAETQANSLEMKSDGSFPFELELEEANLKFQISKI